MVDVGAVQGHIRKLRDFLTQLEQQIKIAMRSAHTNGADNNRAVFEQFGEARTRPIAQNRRSVELLHLTLVHLRSATHFCPSEAVSELAAGPGAQAVGGHRSRLMLRVAVWYRTVG